MNIKELKAMIAQQTVQTLIESTVNEVSTLTTRSAGRMKGPATADTKLKTTVDQETESELPNEAVVYHAKKKLHQDARDTRLPDNLRKSAAHISSRQSFVPNAELDSVKVDPREVTHHLVNYIVEPYSSSEQVKPYFEYLESEQEEAAHEKSDEEESLQTIAGDDLDLVNVDPETGEATKATISPVSATSKTVPGRARIKETSLQEIDEAIKRIKSVLKN